MIQSRIFKVCCMLKQPLRGCKGRWVANCVVFLFFSFVCMPLKTPRQSRESLEFLEPSFEKRVDICFFCGLPSLISHDEPRGRMQQSSRVSCRGRELSYAERLASRADLSWTVTSEQNLSVSFYSKRISEGTQRMDRSADLMAFTRHAHRKFY